MSFQWPLVLLCLLAIPLLALLYVVLQRRRTRYAVRFTNLDLLANVVSETPSWRPRASTCRARASRGRSCSPPTRRGR
jgi:hypothetical protein